MRDIKISKINHKAAIFNHRLNLIPPVKASPKSILICYLLKFLLLEGENFFVFKSAHMAAILNHTENLNCTSRSVLNKLINKLFLKKLKFLLFVDGNEPIFI